MQLFTKCWKKRKESFGRFTSTFLMTLLGYRKKEIIMKIRILCRIRVVMFQLSSSFSLLSFLAFKFKKLYFKYKWHFSGEMIAKFLTDFRSFRTL